MGSWNGTCAISQLPIVAGDPVVAIITKHVPWEENWGGGFSYAHGVWAPVMLPIEGVYNDYGGIEDIKKNWQSELLFKHLTEASKNLVADTEKFGLGTLEEMINDGIERNRFVVKNTPLDARFLAEVPYGFIMMHKQVYDNAVTLTKNYKEFKTSETPLEDAKEHLVTLVRSWQEFQFSQEKPGYLPIHADGCGLVRSSTDWESDGLLESYLNEPDPMTASQYNEVLIDFFCFRWFMSLTRRDYNPQPGAGSQDENWGLHKKFLMATTGFIREYEAKRKAMQDD